jgi:hypothetical protein
MASPSPFRPTERARGAGKILNVTGTIYPIHRVVIFDIYDLHDRRSPCQEYLSRHLASNWQAGASTVLSPMTPNRLLTPSNVVRSASTVSTRAPSSSKADAADLISAREAAGRDSPAPDVVEPERLQHPSRAGEACASSDHPSSEVYARRGRYGANFRDCRHQGRSGCHHVIWSDAQTLIGENIGEAPTRVLMIEME